MDSFNAKEFSKRYRQTHIGVQFKGDSEPVGAYIQEINQDDNGIWRCHMHTYNKVGKQTKQWHAFSDFKVLPIPDKQLIDVRGMTYMFNRLPNRQYQKGLNTQNASLYPILWDFLKTLPKEYNLGLSNDTLRSGQFDVETVCKLYDRQKPKSIFEAIDELESDNKTMSVKLSNIYFITLCPYVDTPFLLFRYTIPIAFFSKDRMEFVLIKELYEQEVIDFCSRNNLPCKVRRKA